MNTAAKQPTDLNDDLSDLIGSDLIIPAARVDRAPSTYVPATERVYTEKCPKCAGSGQTRWGVCFRCKGKGGKTFKTSPETRAANRASAQNAKAAAADLWYADHADVAEWIIKNPGFGFAVSLGQAVQKYGSLTDAQLAAARKCIAKDAERAEQRKAEAQARTVEIGTALYAAFETAKAQQAKVVRKEGSRRKPPRLTFGAFFVEEAKRHPGTLYVKTRGGEYYGKVVDGRFAASRECPQAVRDTVAELVKDPKATAIAYGQKFGICCVCNAELTNPESIAAGIGPICATNMGW